MAVPRAFALDRRGKMNTDDIYAQLQAPAQRAAVQQAMNDAVSKGVPTIVPIRDDLGQPTGASYLQSNKGASYEQARRAADEAAYRVTIDPKQLAAGIGSNVNPGFIKNATINPVAEGNYDLSYIFDWAGRPTSGPSVTPPRETAADRLMAELRYGRDRQAATYQDALNKAITATEYQQNIGQTAYEAAKLNQPYSYHSAVAGGDSYVNGVQGYFDIFGNFIPNPTGSGTGAHNAATQITSGYSGPTPQELFQAAQLQASQTKLSDSFYRGDRAVTQPTYILPFKY